MNAEQKQRAEQIVSQWGHTSAGTMGHAWAGRSAVALLQELIDAPDNTPPANNQSEQHLEMVNPPATSVPVLTVECEPDYWSGGHYHEGTKPHIDPTAVWGLPIGTKLYTAPVATEQVEETSELTRQRDKLLAALTEIAELDILKYHHAYAIARGAIEELTKARAGELK